MEFKLTKDKLMANDGELAYELARDADQDFARSEFAQDYDIVRIGEDKCVYYDEYINDYIPLSPAYTNYITYDCIASWLAYNSHSTGWGTYNYKILGLGQDDIAYWLSFHSRYTGWSTHELNILVMCHESVAINLSYNSQWTGWTTNKEAILDLGDGRVRMNLQLPKKDIGQLKLF